MSLTSDIKNVDNREHKETMNDVFEGIKEIKTDILGEEKNVFVESTEQKKYLGQNLLIAGIVSLVVIVGTLIAAYFLNQSFHTLVQHQFSAIEQGKIGVGKAFLEYALPVIGVAAIGAGIFYVYKKHQKQEENKIQGIEDIIAHAEESFEQEQPEKLSKRKQDIYSHESAEKAKLEEEKEIAEVKENSRMSRLKANLPSKKNMLIGAFVIGIVGLLIAGTVFGVQNHTANLWLQNHIVTPLQYQIPIKYALPAFAGGALTLVALIYVSKAINDYRVKRAEEKAAENWKKESEEWEWM